jgi:hypothetical protein
MNVIFRININNKSMKKSSKFRVTTLPASLLIPVFQGYHYCNTVFTMDVIAE